MGRLFIIVEKDSLRGDFRYAETSPLDTPALQGPATIPTSSGRFYRH